MYVCEMHTDCFRNVSLLRIHCAASASMNVPPADDANLFQSSALDWC